jgi:1-phosphofructokinase
MKASGRLAVLAPAPVMTVMIERHARGEPEIHVHAGGQGFWVARMASLLGAAVAFCTPLGGETGTVLGSLLAEHDLDLRIVACRGANGAYVQQRDENGRTVLAETRAVPLSRHEADDLYGAMLTAGLEADVAVLTGTYDEGVLDPDFYRRLARDLRVNGRFVAADLSRDALTAALSGGIDLLHINERELREHSGSDLDDTADIAHACRRLHDEGAENVIVSRGAEPAVALVAEGAFELRGPRFAARDPHGTGDTMFGAISAAIAQGDDMTTALRRGMAGGALNATRAGFGTGTRDDIRRVAGIVAVEPLD